MLFGTVLKAVVMIAIPITLVVYACLFVGARWDEDTPESEMQQPRQ